jgi:uncharacterized protein YndB with AHSA1/START domain
MRIIRREILIAAPAARVWKHITDPAKIAGWLMPNDFESGIGRAFSLDCGIEGKIRCVVKEIVPKKKLVYSWTSAQLKIETTVTITLKADQGGTLVTLVHSGWDALPPSEEGKSRSFGEGWKVHLKLLRKQVAGAGE